MKIDKYLDKLNDYLKMLDYYKAMSERKITDVKLIISKTIGG